MLSKRLFFSKSRGTLCWNSELLMLGVLCRFLIEMTVSRLRLSNRMNYNFVFVDPFLLIVYILLYAMVFHS